eukprot:scaffold269471_cov36-Prasinocladus_malaysianus.AAC.1
MPLSALLALLALISAPVLAQYNYDYPLADYNPDTYGVAADTTQDYNNGINNDYGPATDYSQVDGELPLPQQPTDPTTSPRPVDETIPDYYQIDEEPPLPSEPNDPTNEPGGQLNNDPALGDYQTDEEPPIPSEPIDPTPEPRQTPSDYQVDEEPPLPPEPTNSAAVGDPSNGGGADQYTDEPYGGGRDPYGGELDANAGQDAYGSGPDPVFQQTMEPTAKPDPYGYPDPYEDGTDPNNGSGLEEIPGDPYGEG